MATNGRMRFRSSLFRKYQRSTRFRINCMQKKNYFAGKLSRTGHLRNLRNRTLQFLLAVEISLAWLVGNNNFLSDSYGSFNNSNSVQKIAKANSAQEREKGRARGHRWASGRRSRRTEMTGRLSMKKMIMAAELKGGTTIFYQHHSQIARLSIKKSVDGGIRNWVRFQRLRLLRTSRRG
jgi:hypothetical protein